MRFFRQVMRLFLLCCIGDILSSMLPFPFPGSVIALVLLFLALVFKVIKPEQINIVSDFLLKNMAFVFLPATVSIIDYLDVFKPILWQFLLVCIISTVVTFLCTAYSVKLTIFIINKLQGGAKNAE